MVAAESLMATLPLVVLVRLSSGSPFQRTVRSPPKPVKPQLAEELDSPLVIHCTTNAQIADRFDELIKHGLPKYHCATVTDGGVCVSLLVPDCEKVPGHVHQQNQDTRYYTLPDGTWLTVLSCDEIVEYCWYRTPLEPKTAE